nr:ABC transporter ATP-binding protein [Caproiciproducens faecalis]
MGRFGGGMNAPGEKAKDFGGTLRQLLHYADQYLPQMIAVLVLAAGSSAFSVIGPKMLGKVTTKLYEGLIAYAMRTGLLTDFKYIANHILFLVGLYLLSALFAYIQGYVMSGISMKIAYQLRKDVTEKINRMPLRYFDSRTHGEVLSLVTNDIDTVAQTLNQSMTQLITSVATIVGVLIMMLSISFLMTAATLLILPLSAFLLASIMKPAQKQFRQQQEYLGHVNGQVEENYAGHNVVQAFNGEAKAVETFKGYNKKLYESAWASQFLSGMMMPIMTFVGNLGYVMVCILGGYLAVKKAVTVGDVQAFIQYVRQFTQPIAQTANIMNTLQSTAAAAERVFAFLAEEEETPDPESPALPDSVRGIVDFENVRFGYTEDKIIINDFTCKVHEGQSIAIVGPTGAGKSTIIKLLMRFYDINSGDILIDGRSIRDYTREGLRSIFGMVLQDTWLYNASILDNIRYGSFDKSDEQVMAAAKAAHCDEFIRALPDGYHMMLNEEASNLSQGQKQLLTIARTVLSDPKILILDEATSSVDTRTEVMIQKAMDALMKDRTSFVIAHRLSTIRGANMILVMKDGDIVEQGSHDELLAKNGFYANLYQSQFENGGGEEEE